MRVYQCQDCMEGIFTAIYNAYEDKSKPQDTRISLTDELLLFAEYVTVEINWDKAMKVTRTLKNRFGEENYSKICFALSAPDLEKAQAVYQTVARGLSCGVGRGHLIDNLADDAVHKVFQLARGAENEFCHLRGFVRFQEVQGDVLYSKIAPKNNMVSFLMPHFADRFPMENFMIYDEGRRLFGIHPAGKEWFLMQDKEAAFRETELVLSEKETEYQELFRYFCHKIAIKERENLLLQRNMLPLRFQDYMVEFN